MGQYRPSKSTIDFLEMPILMEDFLCLLLRLNVNHFLFIFQSQHGGKDADQRHAGDFGNIVSDGATTKVDFDVDLSSFGTNLEDLIGKRSLGMISHKKSLISFFGHKDQIKNCIEKFDM